MHAGAERDARTHLDSGVRARPPELDVVTAEAQGKGSTAQCEKACKIAPAHRHIRSVMCSWRESKFFASFFFPARPGYGARFSLVPTALWSRFFSFASRKGQPRERAREGRQPLQPSSPKLPIAGSLVSALLIVCHRLTLSAIPQLHFPSPSSPLCSSSHASHRLCLPTSTFSSPPLAPTSSAAAKLPPLPVYLFIRRSSSVSLRLSSSLFALTSSLPSHTPSNPSAKLRIRSSSSLPTPSSSSSLVTRHRPFPPA